MRRLQGGTSLLDSAFLRPRFARELRDVDYGVVHIASHGQFGSNPSRTFVLAYDGRLNLDDLENDIKLARFRDPGLELLVLSACQTAAGDDRAALGLARLALKAGARSALATLWSVSDQASGPLVVNFYKQLRSGTASKAWALQAAQRDHGIRLAPDLLCVWSVTVAVDPRAPSRDLVGTALIQYRPGGPALQAAAREASPDRRMDALLRAGYWYDAVALAVRNRDGDGGAALARLLQRAELRAAGPGAAR